VGSAAAVTRGSRFVATLTAAQEVPAPAGAPSGASGSFTATLQGKVLTWRLSFSHLSSAATAAYIHLGGAGAVGPQLLRLCGPCGSPASGRVTLSQVQVVDLMAGLTYVNLGTSDNPHGETRGPIRVRAAGEIAIPSLAGGSGGSVNVGSGGGGHASHVSHASHASHSSHFSSG
jgi:hypothetical protein